MAFPPIEKPSPVPLGKFPAHVKYMHSNDDAMFIKEFAVSYKNDITYNNNFFVLIVVLVN